MKKLLIISTLILGLSPFTYGAELLVETAGSTTKHVCQGLQLTEGIEAVDKCVQEFVGLELDDQNYEHLDQMILAEENLVNRMGPYICSLRAGTHPEGMDSIRVEIVSPISFESRLETSSHYGDGVDWKVIAWAKLKCILP